MYVTFLLNKMINKKKVNNLYYKHECHNVRGYDESASQRNAVEKGLSTYYQQRCRKQQTADVSLYNK